MSIIDPFPRAGGADNDALPPAWTFDARGTFEPWQFEAGVRPWNWAELTPGDANQLWVVLEEFVSFFNQRYVERMEQRIPPCWAEHGALVEELTTLCFARWQAYHSDHASIGGALYWHQYSVPGFIDRMARWIGPDRLERCRQGHHEPPTETEPPAGLRWEHRRSLIAASDIEQREVDLSEGRLQPRARSRVRFLEDKHGDE
jgi:hypothetical protein